MERLNLNIHGSSEVLASGEGVSRRTTLDARIVYPLRRTNSPRAVRQRMLEEISESVDSGNFRVGKVNRFKSIT